ncbi:FecCD family ABC transporter permease [Paenibacillus phyllosphaerae]|nr:iron ABC transporter permease [Paenibacillus phyllosphaerae]
MSRSKRAAVVAAVIALLIVGIMMISLNTGSFRLSPYAVARTLVGLGNADERLVLFEYRMPRMLVAMLAGLGLGVAGAILQGLSRNSLADPGVIGLNAGAAFGLIAFMSFFPSLEGLPSLFIPLFTFGGGLLAAGIVVLLAYERNKGVLPMQLLLIGIAVSAGFSALTLFFSLRLDEDTYAFAARWLAGTIWGRDWIHVAALVPWIAVLVPFTITRSKSLDAFAFGDEIAIGIGTSLHRNRLVLLGVAVALSCASVSMAGGIGFIGLIAPQLARRLVGPMHRHLLPVSGLVGMAVLAAADTIGRSLFQPIAIPAGVVVASISAPYFLYVLKKTKSI